MRANPHPFRPKVASPVDELRNMVWRATANPAAFRYAARPRPLSTLPEELTTKRAGQDRESSSGLNPEHLLGNLQKHTLLIKYTDCRLAAKSQLSTANYVNCLHYPSHAA